MESVALVLAPSVPATPLQCYVLKLHSTVIFLALTVFFHSSILQHPNVLQCIGQCVEAIPYLLVFEFCDLVSAFTCCSCFSTSVNCSIFTALCS